MNSVRSARATFADAPARHDRGRRVLATGRKGLLLGLGVAHGAATFAQSSEAQAQQATTQYAVDRFEPSERGSTWFANESLDLRTSPAQSLAWNAGLVGSYAFRSFVFRDARGEITRSPVRNLYLLHTGATVVLFDRLRVGVNLPLGIYLDGRSTIVNGRTFPGPSGDQGAGDLRAGVDLRLFGSFDDAVTVAVGVHAWAPTGQASRWLGDDGWRLRSRVAAAGVIARYAVWSMQAHYTYREHTDSFGARSGAVGSEVGFAAAAGVGLLSGRRLVVGPEVVGATVVDGSAFLAKGSTPVDGLVGAHLWFGGGIRIGAGVGRGFTGGLGSPAFRGLLSVEWSPEPTKRSAAPPKPADRDGDGVLDAEDACPESVGVRSKDPSENGCPDRDGDGVADIHDACPDRRGPRTNDPKTNGCPKDSDFDDIPDERDACPYRPGIATNDPETNGCPPDTDGDGVDDLDDACPTIPGPRTDDERTNGCDLDRDKDGIPNDVDACPLIPGLLDPDPRRNGCPKAYVRNDQIRLLDQPKFRAADLVLADKDTSVTLEAVAKVLVDHPEIKRLRIEAHTDDRGDPKANKKLSGDRANAVMKWLISKGIDASRLLAEGQGSDKPTDTNETEIGRSNNRRLELHILP